MKLVGDSLEGRTSHARRARVPVIVLALLASLAAACADTVPAPAVTIYPGDVIADAMLTEVTTPYALPAGAAVMDRARAVGRVARRTLLPGKPIPAGALDEPRLVTNGASVRLVFDEPGLTIATFGQAMESGGLGAVVRVRNTESGVIVTGVVQADGAVKVGG